MSDLQVTRSDVVRRHRHSPRVRRLAREAGVDLERVQASGRHGRATAADVAAAVAPTVETTPPIAPRPASKPPRQMHATVVPSGRLEAPSHHDRIVADRMPESTRLSAHLTTVVEVDLSHVTRARDTAAGEFLRRHHVPLTLLAFVTEAAMHALGAHPSVNARLGPDARTVTHLPDVHLGVAVDTDEGLVLPVLHDADDLSVAGLARRIADVAARARSGTITPDELTGGTFAVTDMGAHGALFDTPMISQAQSAVLGLGAVVRRPVVVLDASGQEHLAIRSMAYLSMTYDHRLIDSAEAARYLRTVQDRLEHWNVTALGVAAIETVRA